MALAFDRAKPDEGPVPCPVQDRKNASSEIVHGAPVPAKIHHQTRLVLSESEAAASANRARAGSDFAPIFFMIEARWFSTVRWLRLRSAAMFLLG